MIAAGRKLLGWFTASLKTRSEFRKIRLTAARFGCYRLPAEKANSCAASFKDIPGRDRYYDRIKALVGQRSDWIHFEENLSRHELLELIGHHRFGIYAMEE